MYLAYFVAVGGFLFVARRFLLETEWPFLVLAGIAFAISIGADVTTETGSTGFETMVQDGGKLLGILTWVAYLGHTAFTQLRRELAAAGTTRPPLESRRALSDQRP